METRTAMKKKDDGLRKLYYEVYRLIVKDRRILSELYNHGLDCSVFNNLLTEPVIPEKELKTMMQRLGMNETQILEVHLKKSDPEQYTDISWEMGFALRGFRSLEKSNRLNPSEKKQLHKICARIYETYKDDLWNWYLKKFNADSGAEKDIKTEKQSLEWLCRELFKNIEPYRIKASKALTKDIPKKAIHEMIADILNHAENQRKLTSNKVKWYIENYEKIKT